MMTTTERVGGSYRPHPGTGTEGVSIPLGEWDEGSWVGFPIEDMGQQRYLYWTSVSDFLECPRKYLWSHGHGDIDLGRGPGRSKEKPVKDSRHHAFMGIVIAKVIENLYNHELWKEPAKLREILTEMVRKEFTLSVGETYIDWRLSPSKEELHKVCLDGVLGYLQTMKSNKLLGPYARAEVDLTVWVDKYTPIGGRPDVIIRREDTGVTIIDGKNGMTPGKYTDPQQLQWYALCFYLAYSVIPNRLAFCYFRYPDGSPPKGHDPTKPWTGLVDVPVVRDDLTTLAVKAKGVYRSIGERMFDPTPSSKSCKFCAYETVCDARISQKSINAKTRVADDVLGESSGIVNLGFVPTASVVRKKK